ncbi:MAG: hypothetical protein WB611_06675 [Stellaceae bacterium]
MGLKVAHGMLKFLPRIVAEGVRRRGFAQGIELRPGEREPCGQCRHEFAAGIDHLGEGGVAEALGKAGVETERLQAPLDPDRAGWIAVMLMGENPAE